ncbi:hypothetical protein [Halobaculum sp. D14]|uniref:hypothetical protein n=1 Tax=Halobaculum sp. D14 TaxID=3421642 RepID=UPI003EC0A878
MRRRTVLALLGSTASAGCSTLGSPPTDTADATRTRPARSTDETPTPADGGDVSPLEPEKDWSLVAFQTLPVTVALPETRSRTRDDGSVAMQFARTATADGPALLRGTFTNRNDAANTFDLHALPLFQSVPSAWPGGRPRSERYTYRDELVLAPTADHDLATATPAVALADDGRWRLDDPVDGPWFPEQARLGPGESVRIEYALVGRGEGSGFPRARYRFDGHGDRTVDVAVWSTDHPGPTGDSRFAGASPPALPEATRMAWYHGADAATTSFLRPESERVELPASVDYTLVNHGRSRLAGNPYFWRLWKLVDGRWFHVAPRGWPVPLSFVPPGGTETWTLAAFDEHAIDTGASSTVGFLGGGRYAFEVGVGRERRTDAALLDVEAPAATLEPTEGLTVTRDGSRVRVRWPRRADEVPRATLTLTRADAGDTAETRLITEQVMQPHNAALRNTLPYVEDGVTAVSLVTDRNTVSRGARTGGYEPGRFRFRYEGAVYEAAATFDGA